jgi:hypothetical protein
MFLKDYMENVIFGLFKCKQDLDTTKSRRVIQFTRTCGQMHRADTLK